VHPGACWVVACVACVPGASACDRMRSATIVAPCAPRRCCTRAPRLLRAALQMDELQQYGRSLAGRVAERGRHARGLERRVQRHRRHAELHQRQLRRGRRHRCVSEPLRAWADDSIARVRSETAWPADVPEGPFTDTVLVTSVGHMGADLLRASRAPVIASLVGARWRPARAVRAIQALIHSLHAPQSSFAHPQPDSSELAMAPSAAEEVHNAGRARAPLTTCPPCRCSSSSRCASGSASHRCAGPRCDHPPFSPPLRARPAVRHLGRAAHRLLPSAPPRGSQRIHHNCAQCTRALGRKAVGGRR
jgi:hypothetical protein